LLTHFIAAACEPNFGNSSAASISFEIMKPLIEKSAAERRQALGFRDGLSGGLMARTMMSAELAEILAQTPETADIKAIGTAIVDGNILGKPTLSSRKKSLSHLIELYGLDLNCALFRVLRRLAVIDPALLPVLALVCVYCRDPQLRASFGLIRTLRIGETLSRVRMEEHLESCFPNRFSAAFKKSLAQNVNASWTAAGHLAGRLTKVRTLPKARPVAATYAMLAGYLSGLRGHRLLQSEFGELASPDASLIPNLLSLASARGLLSFKHAGGVVEFDFSPLLNDHERALTDVTH